ncbi:hypothetical protein ACP70R_022345 [Stipagrostis hirtigluma subsp. patula]
MAGLSTGAGPPVVNVYHEKSMILPDVSRVLACLYEKDVKFETIKASYKDILSLQASRSVPVPFYDGPVFLQDSRAICRYIAEKYKHQGYPFLLGKDVLERASIEQWLRNEEHAFDPPSRALFCHLAFPIPNGEEDEEDINRETRKLDEVLEVYEQRLGETEFLAGNKFTLADLVHLPGTHHVITSERFAYLYDSRRNVQRWWNTISARDSWQQVLRDMKTVEEQHRKEEEELEQQQQRQWQAETLPQFGVRDVRIDPRMQEGTKPQTVLVAPPSTGIVSTSIPSTSSDQKPSPPIQTKQDGFFTTTEKPPPPSGQTDSSTQKPPSNVDTSKITFFTPASTPTTAKMHQKTDAEKSSHKDATSPSKPSQISPKEVSDKPHLSDFFNASQQNNQARSPAKPSLKPAKTPEVNQTSGAVAYDKPSRGTARDPHETDEPDSRETESKDTQRVTDASVSHEAVEKQKSAVHPPSVEQHDEQVSTESADRGAAAHLPGHTAPKYAQGETEKQSTYHGAPDVTKQATEADQDRATSPAQQDIKGVSNDDERFKTARLRRMLTASEAPELQSVDSEAPAIPKKPSDALSKKATEADKNKGTLSSAQEEPSVGQNAKRQAKIPPTAPKVSDLSPLQVDSKEHTKGVISDERFRTERLRRMFEESEAAALQSQAAESQAPTKEEESAISKKPSDVHDREKQTAMAQDIGKTDSSPSTGTRAPYTPTTGDKSITISPPKGRIVPDDRVTAGPEKSPSINEQETTSPVPTKSPTTSASSAPTSPKSAPPPNQQASPAPSTDQLGTTPVVDMRAPQKTSSDARNGSTLVQETDSSTQVRSDEESDKRSNRGERAPEATPRKVPPSDISGTSAPNQEAILDARGNQSTEGQGGVPDIMDTGDSDRTKKTVFDKRAAEPASSSQQTTEPFKGGSPTVYGITGDESTNRAMADPRAAPPAPVQAPASDGQNASTVLDNGKNEAVKPSTAVERGVLPITPGRLEPTPDTQHHTTSGQMSAQSPPMPSLSDTRSEKTDRSETDQTSSISTNEQPGPGGRVPRNAGGSSSGPSPINEAYKEGAAVQNPPGTQSTAELAENKMKGDDTATVAETGKPEEDSFANANANNTGQLQETNTNAPSNLQIESDRNKSKVSIDGGKQTNKTTTYPILSPPKEVPSSPPEKSMRQQQQQVDGSGTSLQDDLKQGTTEQQKNKDLLTNTDKNTGETTGAIKSEEQAFSDTQQVTNNINNSKSDGPSKPTRFGGNEGNLSDTERRGP